MVGTGWAIVITIVVLGVVGSVAWVLYSRHRAQRLGLPPPSFTSFLPFLHKSDQTSSYGAPGPRPGGVQGWFGDQVRKFKERNNRTAAGAYEGAPRGGPPGATGGGRRGFGPLDPDEAWDARVGNEADNYGPGGYYEEQELGLHSQGPYGASSSHHLHADDDTHYGGAARHGGVGGGSDGGGGGGGGGGSYAMNLAATPRMKARDADDDDDDDIGRGRSREVGGGAARNPFDDDAAEPSNISLRGVSPRPLEGGETHGRGHGGKVTSDNASERRSIFTEQV